MMDKYLAFRQLMDFVSDYADVTDADMNYYEDTLRIIGENDDEYIEIRVTIKKTNKEEDENA